MNPLTLANGTSIDTTSGLVIVNQTNIAGKDDDDLLSLPATPLDELPITTKKLSDLPVTPKQMNTFGVVITYVMCGIDNEGISKATKLEIEHIVAIREMDSYIEIQKLATETLLLAKADKVREIISQQSELAARTIGRGLISDNEATRLVAAKDVLDRAGHRPVDVVEHKHKMEGGLTIEVIRRDKDQNVPIIDITPEEI